MNQAQVIILFQGSDEFEKSVQAILLERYLSNKCGKKVSIDKNIELVDDFIQHERSADVLIFVSRKPANIPIDITINFVGKPADWNSVDGGRSCRDFSRIERIGNRFGGSFSFRGEMIVDITDKSTDEIYGEILLNLSTTTNQRKVERYFLSTFLPVVLSTIIGYYGGMSVATIFVAAILVIFLSLIGDIRDYLSDGNIYF